MEKLEQDIKKYLKARGWDNLRPGDLAKSVSIESGELLELFQWNNPSLEEVKKDKEKMELIKKELADVLLYCLDLSVSLDLSTEKIIRSKLAHITKKYPAKLMKNRTQEAGTEDLYWKIKKEYRKQGI
jgi:dCTP diphosphatase